MAAFAGLVAVGTPRARPLVIVLAICFEELHYFLGVDVSIRLPCVVLAAVTLPPDFESSLRRAGGAFDSQDLVYEVLLVAPLAAACVTFWTMCIVEDPVATCILTHKPAYIVAVVKVGLP